MIGETICIHDAIHHLVSRFISFFCGAISHIITCTTTPAGIHDKSEHTASSADEVVMACISIKEKAHVRKSCST